MAAFGQLVQQHQQLHELARQTSSAPWDALNAASEQLHSTLRLLRSAP
jgi:hypothetical protein